MSPDILPPTMFERVKGIASFLRDLGLILGIPAIVTLGLSIYELQNKAHEAEIKALEAQNAVLKETQFDRAVALIKAQKEAYELDKENTANQITQLRSELSQSKEILSSDLRKVASNISECTAKIISLIDIKTMNDTLYNNKSDIDSKLSDEDKQKLFFKSLADTVSSICNIQR